MRPMAWARLQPGEGARGAGGQEAIGVRDRAHAADLTHAYALTHPHARKPRADVGH